MATTNKIVYLCFKHFEDQANRKAAGEKNAALWKYVYDRELSGRCRICKCRSRHLLVAWVTDIRKIYNSVMNRKRK